MPVLSITELAERLDLTATGALPRRQAADWARERLPSQSNPAFSFPKGPDGTLAWFAMAALASADLSPRLDRQEFGPPYFIREHDLHEWALTLRGTDWLGTNPYALQPKRMHQLRRTPIDVAMLAIPVELVIERLAVPSLRGLDDLDYYEQIIFDDLWERQIFLSWYKRGPSPDARLCLEEGADAANVIDALLRALGVDEHVVSWRASADSKDGA